MYDGSNTTGFMSPAGDHVDSPIDLSRALNLAAPSRYPVRVKGNSFASRGILDGDFLIVDTSLKPSVGSIVVAFAGDEVVLSLVEKHGNKLALRRPGEFLDTESCDVWAVAVGLVRDML